MKMKGPSNGDSAQPCRSSIRPGLSVDYVQSSEGLPFRRLGSWEYNNNSKNHDVVSSSWPIITVAGHGSRLLCDSEILKSSRTGQPIGLSGEP